MKVLSSILLAVMISSLMPNVQAGGNVQCVINIMPKMNQITTNPVGIFMEFSACAGDQSWDLMAPFLGGFMRVILASINTVLPESQSKAQADLVSADFQTGFTTLELYNLVMDMIK